MCGLGRVVVGGTGSECSYVCGEMGVCMRFWRNRCVCMEAEMDVFLFGDMRVQRERKCLCLWKVDYLWVQGLSLGERECGG